MSSDDRIWLKRNPENILAETLERWRREYGKTANPENKGIEISPYNTSSNSMERHEPDTFSQVYNSDLNAGEREEMIEKIAEKAGKSRKQNKELYTDLEKNLEEDYQTSATVESYEQRELDLIGSENPSDHLKDLYFDESEKEEIESRLKEELTYNLGEETWNRITSKLENTIQEKGSIGPYMIRGAIKEEEEVYRDKGELRSAATDIAGLEKGAHALESLEEKLEEKGEVKEHEIYNQLTFIDIV